MWPVASVLLNCCVDPEVRIFCRSQACAMLAGMITNQTVSNLDGEEWRTLAVDCMSKMLGVVTLLVTDDQQRPKYTQGVLQVILQLLKVGKPDMFEAADLAGLKENIIKLKSSSSHKNNKDLKKVFNRVLDTLYRSLPSESKETPKKKKQKKRKAEKDDAAEEPTAAKSPKLEETSPVTMVTSPVSDNVQSVKAE